MTGSAFLGIDPGADGGLAIIHPLDGILVEIMPKKKKGGLDARELARFLVDVQEEIRMAFVENIYGMPVGKGIQGAFSQGANFGALVAIVEACGIPYRLVNVGTWQKAMFIGRDPKLDSKSKARLTVEELFPHVDCRATEKSRTMHGGIVDALLIAEYGRKLELGLPL